MMNVWNKFLEDYPWVCKLPLIDCLEFFYKYLQLRDNSSVDRMMAFIKEIDTFKKSTEMKDDIFKNKV